MRLFTLLASALAVAATAFTQVWQWDFSKSIAANINQTGLWVHAYGVQSMTTPKGCDWTAIQDRIAYWPSPNVLYISRQPWDHDIYKPNLQSRTEFSFEGNASLAFPSGSTYQVKYTTMSNTTTQRAVLLQLMSHNGTNPMPLIHLMIWRSSYVVRGYAISNWIDLQPITVLPLVAGQWVNWQLTFHLSRTSDGYFILLANGTQVFSFKGATQLTTQLTFLAFGVYSNDAVGNYVSNLQILH